MRKYIILIFIFSILFNIKLLQAQSLESPLKYQGGASSLLYKADTVVLENTIIDDCITDTTSQTEAIGFRFFYSQFYKLNYFPVILPLSDNFSFDFSIPYIHKEKIINDIDYTKSGFGDIKTAINFNYNIFKDFTSLSSIKITYPTGNEVARDNTQIMPLGYGTNTFSFLQSFSFNANFFRIFGNTGIIYYHKVVYDINSTERYVFDSNYAYSFLIGTELNINSFSFQLKGNYIKLQERKYKYEDISTQIATEWSDFNDAYKTANIIGSIKHNFNPATFGRITYIYPIYEKQDSDITETFKRTWEIFFIIERNFSISSNNNPTKTRKKNNEKKRKRRTRRKR